MRIYGSVKDKDGKPISGAGIEVKEESFETISAYGANAAMCHYTPSDERDVTVEPWGLYLVDSGGQYPEGTTDITRTLACGPVSDVERLSYTLSVIANLRLAAARFPEGVSGLALDGIAREVFWERGLDFDHGTGHGVGFCLNVHEGPYAIRCRAAAGKSGPGFQAGIYISDEPGHYVEGSHGVRTENLLLCVKDGEASGGEKRFLKFETMTLCPLDKKPLDVSLMTARDISLFDEYHRMVFSRLSPLLDEEERRWLFEACRPL